MRAACLVVLAALIAAPASAQHVSAQHSGQGGAGKHAFQNLRSYTIRNDSIQVIASVRLISTKDGKTLFETRRAIRPHQANNVRVGRADCLAGIVVHFKNGRQLQLSNLNDCKRSRISVGNTDIKLESAAVQ